MLDCHPLPDARSVQRSAMRRTMGQFSAFVFAISLMASACIAAPTDALFEKLLDLKALVGSGITYSDYQGRLPEVVVMLDRYRRTGGLDSDLTFAAEAFISAQNYWDVVRKAKLDRAQETSSSYEVARLQLTWIRDAEQDLQSKWQTAIERLDAYALLVKETAAKKKLKPSKDSQKKVAGTGSP